MNYVNYIECFSNNLLNNQFITVKKKNGNLFASVVTMNSNNPTSVPIEDYVGEPSNYFTYNNRTITGFKNEEAELQFKTSNTPFIETYATKIQSRVISSEDITKTSGQLSWNFTNSAITRPIIFWNVTEVDEMGLAKSNFNSIDLPKCTKINDYGLAYSKITSITCPNVEDIGERSFLRTEITEINLPKYDMTNFNSNAIGAFCQCTKLESVTVKEISTDGNYFYLAILSTMASPTNSDLSSSWWYWESMIYDLNGNTFQVKHHGGYGGRAYSI